jgi:hypothetical protein
MINKILAKIAICALGIAFAGNAAATFHLYKINELFSNTDGSIQFIELAEGPDLDGQNLLSGISISVSQIGATTHSFMFPKDLPSAATANTSVLIATQGFADLGIVTPDYIVPAGFLFTNGGTVNYGNVDFMPYASLPTDGVLSLNRDGTTGVNSPKNFAGVTGTVPAAVALSFVPGWNLMGNSSTGPLNAVTAFGDTSKVNTVWKWIASGAKWAFYAPSLVGQVLTDYAASKGYDVLTAIDGGEGFWVNAKTAFTAPLPAGTSATSASFQPTLIPGWTLISIGDDKTPRQFDQALSLPPPTVGEIPLNITSLWAWDANLINWYFYAPSLDANGTLSSYVVTKGYLDFGTKVLDPALGFWANLPTSPPTGVPLVWDQGNWDGVDWQ